MIVGGTFGVKPTIYGAWTALMSGRMGGKSKPPLDLAPLPIDAARMKRDIGQVKKEEGISSIPMLEPATRWLIGIHPLQGSMMHLHQITFAAAYLTNPIVAGILEDFAIDVNRRAGLETEQQKLQRLGLDNY